jgi:signal peptidase I
MDTTINKPRSVFSIILIGLVLGPIFVMLWLGKGRLAIIYLLLSIALSIITYFLEIYDWIDTTPLRYLSTFSLASLVSTAVFYFVGIFHGIKIRQTATSRPWFRWIAIVPAIVFTALLVLALPIRVFLFQPFDIPADSSRPNLMIGDYIFVSKTTYGYSQYSFPFNLANFTGRTGNSHPVPGDLAVFKLPTNTAIDYVKRVVGVPGDRIQMISGTLNINGKPLKLEKIQLAPEFYDTEPITYFRETLPNGRSYVIANMRDDGWADNTIEYIVPANHYFAMGDNRDNSEDSRFLDHVGYIPEENFIGPVVARFWNSKGVSLANRPEETYPPK